jgi:alpha-beta hydrolase superfamily lysophospholipase
MWGVREGPGRPGGPRGARAGAHAARLARLLGVALLLAPGCAFPPVEPLRPAPPAAKGAPSDVVHETGAFEGDGGVLLFEQRWLPRAEAPRAALVIVHGLKDHSARYADFAARMARKGVAVHAYDLRGHARSEGPRVWVDAFEQHVEDLALFLARVRRRAPDRPLFLFGHSMGGAIATLCALERRVELGGLVLSAPALVANVWAGTRGVTRLVAALSPGAGVFQLDLEDFSRDPKVVAEGLVDPLVYQEGAAARTAVELLDALERIGERMEELETPFLALHGTRDVVTDPDGSRALHERARAGDKTLELLDGLAHDLLHEPEKERVAAAIEAWVLARLAPARR